ncbi:uncharacterized protein LOC134188000 [Corticium candelabrum]|uniref:uncharacterized protein LOC134188000 n=1 Tax=Corticium candelabrum TaxID=121492 RepID=UPI002E26A2E1|nr:uncharacterized protein LOC134188000 [Corticium candelabrum]
MACSTAEQREKDILLASQGNDAKHDGKKHKKKGCSSMLWRKFGLPCSPFENLDFSSLIIIEKAVYEEYNDFDGRIEYYGLQKGRHGSVCLRRADGVNPKQAVLVELLVRRPEGRKEWFIQMRRHHWAPAEQGVVSGSQTVSEHEWNEATGLDAVAKVAKNFGQYNPVKKNCRHFIKELKTTMIDEGPCLDAPPTKNYWRLGEYLQEKYGVTLMLAPSDTLLNPNQEDLDAEAPALSVQETEV